MQQIHVHVHVRVHVANDKMIAVFRSTLTDGHKLGVLQRLSEEVADAPNLLLQLLVGFVV